jgi:hypothetical protein
MIRSMFPARSSSACEARSRRGVAVVLVLGVLGVTLAVFYAMMRTQTTSVSIQENVNRKDDARQAAQAGVTAGMRRLHDADWADAGGVDLTLEGDLGEGMSYRVRYATGDDSLTPDSPDYAEYPYRVTITSTGYAADPNNPDVRAERQVEAVVQLVRRALQEAPADWDIVQQHTVYQWADRESKIEYPVRIEGPIRFSGRVAVSEHKLSLSSKFLRYLKDLEKMRRDGRGDHRPFRDTVYLPRSRQRLETLSLLEDDQSLNLTVLDSEIGISAPVPHPGSPALYRLYPGGKEYEIPSIRSKYGATLSGVTLEGNIQENPLGIFFADASISLHDGTTIRGVVISAAGADLDVTGSNVVLTGLDLPPLYGQAEDLRMQLPSAIAGEEFHIASTASATIAGLVMAWDEFKALSLDENHLFHITGRVAAKEAKIEGGVGWDGQLSLLDELVATLGSLILYLPPYLQKEWDLVYEQKPTIRPDPDVHYHWHDWTQPLYAVHPDDAGLLWDLVRWSEQP